MDQARSKVLTVDKWHEMALQGDMIPMPIPINGVSMYPLIRRNRDRVTIVPLREMPVVGDIVLFNDPRAHRYVLHRVIRIDGYRVVTRGDNCPGPDPALMPADVWGKAVLIERGRRMIKPDPRRGMRHARCWYKVGKACRFAARIRNAVLRRIKKIFAK